MTCKRDLTAIEHCPPELPLCCEGRRDRTACNADAGRAVLDADATTDLRGQAVGLEGRRITVLEDIQTSRFQPLSREEA